MFSRAVSLLLLLSLGTDSYALRQTGLEQSPAARQSLLSALSAGAEELGWPGVALSRELWGRFERQMQSRAALEVAA